MAKPQNSIGPSDLALLTSRAKPFSQKGWVFEVKYDGFRALITHGGGKVSIRTRAGTELLPTFPELEADIARLPDLVMDGELVIVDDQGRPQFGRLLSRSRMSNPQSIAHAAATEPAAIFAFDLLQLRGKDLRQQPLLKRKAALEKVLAGAGRLKYLGHIGEEGVRLYEAAAGLELEGIVAKRADAPYRAGRSSDWVKIKTPPGLAIVASRARWNEKW